jgi:hypothetical protein
MKHIGLFEGIGGFSLAARWAGWETIAWCEWNEFGQRVLRHHFPEAIGHGDITKTDFTPYADTIDILTGGFPCQPYSLAGKRKGKDDERHLWPEMLRAIREIRPRWVVGKMFSALLIGQEGWFSTKCKLIWKLRGTKYGRMYFQLRPLTLPTAETGFGLLPTVQARDEKNGSQITDGRIQRKIQQGWTIDLNDLATSGLLPTPTAIQREHPERVQALKESGAATMFSRVNGEARPNSIIDHLHFHGMLPTPATRDWKGARSEEALEEAGRNRNNSLPDSFAQRGKTSQLNPLFVLEMMGFPHDWTISPFLSGETNQSKQQVTQ